MNRKYGVGDLVEVGNEANFAILWDRAHPDWWPVSGRGIITKIRPNKWLEEWDITVMRENGTLQVVGPKNIRPLE